MSPRQQPARSPGRERASGARRAAIAALAATGAVLAAGCTSGGDDIADVTLPELASTTTTSAPPRAAPGADEPLRPVWTLQFGGPGEDIARSLVGRDDTIAVVGSTTGALTSGGAAPPTSAPAGVVSTDAFLAVVGTDGELRSADSTGTAGDDIAAGVAVRGQELLACGSTGGALGAANGGALDLWCGLASTTGDDEPITGVSQFGGSDAEEVTGLAGAEDPATAYAAARVDGLLPGAQDPTGRGLGSGDAATVQLGPGGVPIWLRQFGTPAEDGSLGVTVAPDGDGIVVGYTDGDLGRASAGGRDGWITRFDPAGRQRWLTQLGSPGADVLSSVTAAGEARRGTEQFIAAGTTDGQLAASPSGGGTAPGGATPDTTPAPGTTPPATSDRDAFAAAFTTDGTLAWTTTIGSDGDDRGGAIAADGAVVYVAGTTDGSLGELLPEAGPGGGDDGFLAALDAASGEILWVSRFGSAGDEEITGVTTTEDGFLVLSGTTTGQMSDTDPGGGRDAFLVAFPLGAAGGGAASSV